MKDKRNPLAETILEVDDEEDSPEVEEIVSDWLGDPDTPIIKTANTVNIKPIPQVISKRGSNEIGMDSIRNSNTDLHRNDDVIEEEKNVKTRSVTQHTSGPQTSDSSTHSAASANNKYDSTQRTLSHQSVINETIKPSSTSATTTHTTVPTATLPLSTQMSLDSDNTKRQKDSNNTSLTSLFNKVTEGGDDTNIEDEEIEKENIKNIKNVTYTETKKEIENKNEIEKVKEIEKEKELQKESFNGKETLNIKTTSSILKTSSSTRSAGSEDFGKNFSPLFPESNYVSPSLTTPLGAEGEETLEVRTYLRVY